jgi:uncharacterized cupredoxin-like copper-binding protein
MADPSLDPGTGNDSDGVGPDRGSIASMPRWVKVFLIVTAVVVLLLMILVLTSGGHGPGRHMSGGGVGGPADASEGMVRTVEVATLDTMAFEPSEVDVSAGETVTFLIHYRAGMRGEITIT